MCLSLGLVYLVLNCFRFRCTDMKNKSMTIMTMRTVLIYGFSTADPKCRGSWDDGWVPEYPQAELLALKGLNLCKSA